MTSSTPFLDLPRELRVEILRQLLPSRMVQVVDHPVAQRGCARRRRYMKNRCQSTTIGILRDWCNEADKISLAAGPKLKYFDCSGQTASSHPKPISPAMSLLLLCRQLYEEAVDVVYDQHIFSFDNVRVFRDFVSLHSFASQHIHTLTVAHTFLPGPCQCNRYQYPRQWGYTMLSNPLFSASLEIVFLRMAHLRSVRLLLDNDQMLKEDPLCAEMDLAQTQTFFGLQEMSYLIASLARRRRSVVARPLSHWELLILPNWEAQLPAKNEEIRAEVKAVLGWVHKEVCKDH